jgi:hypothetical protein
MPRRYTRIESSSEEGNMTDRFLRTTFVVIAAFLGVIALRPYLAPPSAAAQAGDINPLYIEPGVQNIRIPDGTGELLGKVMIDMRTGDTWGFPTGSASPYPIRLGKTEPPTTRPIYLGKFDFASMKH